MPTSSRSTSYFAKSSSGPPRASAPSLHHTHFIPSLEEPPIASSSVTNPHFTTYSTQLDYDQDTEHTVYESEVVGITLGFCMLQKHRPLALASLISIGWPVPPKVTPVLSQWSWFWVGVKVVLAGIGVVMDLGLKPFSIHFSSPLVLCIHDQPCMHVHSIAVAWPEESHVWTTCLWEHLEVPACRTSEVLWLLVRFHFRRVRIRRCNHCNSFLSWVHSESWIKRPVWTLHPWIVEWRFVWSHSTIRRSQGKQVDCSGWW